MNQTEDRKNPTASSSLSWGKQKVFKKPEGVIDLKEQHYNEALKDSWEVVDTDFKLMHDLDRIPEYRIPEGFSFQTMSTQELCRQVTAAMKRKQSLKKHSMRSLIRD